LVSDVPGRGERVRVAEVFWSLPGRGERVRVAEVFWSQTSLGEVSHSLPGHSTPCDLGEQQQRRAHIHSRDNAPAGGVQTSLWDDDAAWRLQGCARRCCRSEGLDPLKKQRVELDLVQKHRS